MFEGIHSRVHGRMWVCCMNFHSQTNFLSEVSKGWWKIMNSQSTLLLIVSLFVSSFHKKLVINHTIGLVSKNAFFLVYPLVKKNSFGNQRSRYTTLTFTSFDDYIRTKYGLCTRVDIAKRLRSLHFKNKNTYSSTFAPVKWCSYTRYVSFVKFIKRVLPAHDDDSRTFVNCFVIVKMFSVDRICWKVYRIAMKSVINRLKLVTRWREFGETRGA